MHQLTGNKRSLIRTKNENINQGLADMDERMRKADGGRQTADGGLRIKKKRK